MPARCLGAAVLAACLAAPLLVPAQPAAPRGKAVALLVGVTDYRAATLGPLDWSENDVVELARVLDRPGSPFRGSVRLLTTSLGRKDAKAAPTAANVRAAVADLLADLTRDDTALVALSGHGVQLLVDDPAGRGPQRSFAFFCPEDAQLLGTDYGTGQNPRLVSVGWLMGQLGACGAGTKLVLMDACRNELKARDRALAVGPDAVPEGVSLLLSCSKGERSYEVGDLRHGLFFHHVLEGLRGRAANGRGEVTWGRLAEYVTDGLAADGPRRLGEGRRQTPHLIASLKGRSPVLVTGAVAGTPVVGKPAVATPVVGTPAPGSAVTNSVGMKLVPIRAGKFLRGSPAGEEGRRDDEERMEVTITRPFLMGATEVTQGQYKAVTGTNPSRIKAGDDSPVEGVSWDDAVAFCRKLSAMPAEKAAGRVYRLPTEAEWEYAARAGTTTRFWSGDADADLARVGWYYGNSGAKTQPVGRKPANAWGLFDMHGNVSEWCQDWYGPYSREDIVDPQGAKSGSDRVLRGGTKLGNATECRSAGRVCGAPGTRYDYGAFRVVCAVPSRAP